MVFKKIEEVFGDNALKHGLFYLHQPALRFELSLSGNAIDHFVSAFDRARVIAHKIFENTDKIVVIQSVYVEEGQSSQKVILKSLKDCGIKLNTGVEFLALPAETDEELGRSFMAYTTDKKFLDSLLWGILAQELGIRPKLLGSFYLVNFETQVLIHPYDDRGMDIISPSKVLLKSLFDKFEDWLLEYDLKKMRDMLGDMKT